MGCSNSKQHVLTEETLAAKGTAGPGAGSGSDQIVIGDKAAYAARFEEGRELGQGEFGVVKLVTDTSTKETYASKCLRKGFVFKDNTLYNPMPAETIQRECGILKQLNGERHNMKLVALFEDSKAIYMVTELLSGGEMLDYVADAYGGADAGCGGLRTEDASRMAFQLLDAVDHCAKNGIIHRDLKPENVVFKTGEAGADLKLIDFGCSTRDTIPTPGADSVTHTTFAGTAFYIAPEVFRKSYTSKADVFGVGVILYVLVAGYPADVLQKAFNLLQKSKRDLRKLPNMPSNLPDSYFDLLEKLLTFRPAKRSTAGEILADDEFVAFHKELAAEEAPATSGATPKRSMKRTASVVFSETANRHRLLQSYRKFERSVTTVLATVPTNDELQELVEKLKELSAGMETGGAIAEGDEDEEEGVEVEQPMDIEEGGDNADKLNVVKMGRLKELLGEMSSKEASETISKLPRSSEYDDFAYDVDTLGDFAKRRAASAEYAAAGARDGGGATPQDGSDRRGMAGAKGGGFSMRGGFGAGASSERVEGMTKGFSFRPQPRNGGMGAKSQSVFIR